MSTVDPLSLLGGKLLGTETLHSIIGLADTDALELAAWELGENHFLRARAALEGIGEELIFEGFLGDILGEEAGWFRFTVNSKARPRELILEHGVSAKWSIFLRGYVSGAYRVVSKEKLVIDVSENFIRVKLGTDVPKS